MNEFKRRTNFFHIGRFSIKGNLSKVWETVTSLRLVKDYKHPYDSDNQRQVEFRSEQYTNQRGHPMCQTICILFTLPSQSFKMDLFLYYFVSQCEITPQKCIFDQTPVIKLPNPITDYRLLIVSRRRLVRSLPGRFFFPGGAFL